MVSRSPLRLICLAAPVVALALLLPAVAGAADFTWRGHAPTGDPEWSNHSNWVGGVPPSGPVGTLNFPKLGGGCSPIQSPRTCYTSGNDLSGLTVQKIVLENSQGYTLAGNALTLGAGGLQAAPAGQCPCGATFVAMPIVLGADQTWTIDGTLMALDGRITSQTHALQLELGANMSLDLNGVEVGALTISGHSGRFGFGTPFVVLQGRGPGASEVNGVNGKPVKVGGIFLRASQTAVGSLTTSNAVVSGTGGATPGKLSVNGGVTLDRRSEVISYITGSGASPGKDYWQLGATGPVKLAKAALLPTASTSKGFGPDQACPKLKRGTVETLIKTKGPIKGRFNGVRNKGKVKVACAGSNPPVLRIRYKKHAVTAKAL